MADIKLKPCPFCGGTNIIVLSKKKNIWRSGDGDFAVYRVYSARCNYCKARGAAVGGMCAPTEKIVKMYGKETFIHSYKYYHDKAVDVWNRRA